MYVIVTAAFFDENRTRLISSTYYGASTLNNIRLRVFDPSKINLMIISKSAL